MIEDISGAFSGYFDDFKMLFNSTRYTGCKAIIFTPNAVTGYIIGVTSISKGEDYLIHFVCEDGEFAGQGIEALTKKNGICLMRLSDVLKTGIRILAE